MGKAASYPPSSIDALTCGNRFVASVRELTTVFEEAMWASCSFISWSN
jgi:hypothetical protein